MDAARAEPLDDTTNDENVQPTDDTPGAVRQPKKKSAQVRCSPQGSAVLTTCVQHQKDPMLSRLKLNLKQQCNIGDFAVLLLEPHGYVIGADGSLAHPDFPCVLRAGATGGGGSRAAKRPGGDADGDAVATGSPTGAAAPSPAAGRTCGRAPPVRRASTLRCTSAADRRRWRDCPRDCPRARPHHPHRPPGCVPPRALAAPALQAWGRH